MKKILFTVALGGLAATAILSSQETSTKQTASNGAAPQVLMASMNPQTVSKDYPAFKRDAEQKIADNDKRIADLRAKSAASGKMDDMRKKKIEDLEKQNADLRAELKSYEAKPSDWEKFKLRFNHDADKLNKAFSDFGADLKQK